MTTQTQHAKRLFNADEYYAMGEAGILPEGGSELLGGVVYMKGVGKPWRFTVDDYYAMAEAGILTHDERVELINGEIIEMSPIGDRHAYSVDEIIDLFFAQLRSRARVRCQNPVRLDGLREIQPDIAILRLRDDLYSTGHPGPADVFLLIEVSDSTLAYDRNVKLPMYANAGIPRDLDRKHPKRRGRGLYGPHCWRIPHPPRIQIRRDRQPLLVPRCLPARQPNRSGIGPSLCHDYANATR